MSTPATIIQKKRDGIELSSEEIEFFIQGVVNGDVADYQASAFLMATYFQSMTAKETVALTQAMLHSGEQYDLSAVQGPKVDKHSTGGIGDKVSLILAPLAAACGLKVPMMSGRGLGHSGGTLDKLESIPGFHVNLTREKFIDSLNALGFAMIGQSQTIAPADRKLYALRDVTGTVECIPLIVGSILSKKVAEGSEALVLDVKVGSGAFMEGKVRARQLASLIVKVAKGMGLKCHVVLSDMNQPLGYAVGNSLEVLESVEVLRRKKILSPELNSSDLKELTLHLCAQMLICGGLARTLSEGRKMASKHLENGDAWEVFRKMVVNQGGDVSVVDDPLKLPLSDQVVTWKAQKAGFISKMEAAEFGRLLVEMGGGRKKAEDSVDPGVGFIFHRKLGARVSPGDPIASVYLPQKIDPTWEERFHGAIQITSARKPVPKLILDVGIK